jgi:hypothetical protein
MRNKKIKYEKRKHCRICFQLMSFFFLAIGQSMAMVEIGDISLDVQFFLGGSTHGYVEYRVGVINLSEHKDHEVTLVIPGKISGSGNNIVRLSRTVFVGAKSNTVVSLFQPCIPIGGRDMTVMIDGVQSDESITIPIVQPNIVYSRWNSSSSACLLVSRGVGSKFNDAAEKKYEEFTSSPVSTSGPAGHMRSSSPIPGGMNIIRPYGNRAEMPVSEWSGNWLTYTRYTMVIVTREEFERMPAEVRDGLFGYMRVGGMVLVEGKPELPKDIVKNETPVGTPASQLKGYSVGFGQLIVSQEPDAEKWDETQWTHLFDLWNNAERPWSALNDTFAAMEESAKFNENRLPVRGMFGLMILFAVVIGPLNLLVLSWKKKRTWLLWTTPVISLVTCLAVFGYNLSAEGLENRIYLDGLTLLDEANHRATTIGWGRYYCPLTPGKGLHFDPQTEVMPIYDTRDIWTMMRTGSPKTLDWTNDQHLSSGWISARSPAYYLFRKDQPRRERLIVRKSEVGKITISNSLGATIKEMTLIDENGNIYFAKNIKAGDEITLVPNGNISESSLKKQVSLSELFQERLTRTESITTNTTRYLRPGMYMAVLERSPFMETGLGGKIELKGESVVCGIMKGAE